MKTRKVASRLLLAAACGGLLTSCAGLMRSPPPPPGTSAWHSYTNGQGRQNIIHVQVNPVGPPSWRYLVESLHPVAVTNSPPPGWSGTGWFPAWHPAGISLTSVTIDAPGCTVLDVSTNWQVVAGSSSTFAQASGGATELRFTLECDKTNGPIELSVTDNAGANTVVKNLNGPR
jgi:hypothetical protein